MKKALIFLVGLLLVVTAIIAWRTVPSSSPSPTTSDSLTNPNPQSPPTTGDTTGLNLTIPSGFLLSKYATELSKPRDLLWVGDTLLVSLPDLGEVVSLSDTQGNGWANTRTTLLSNLNRPHGLAYLDGRLYVAETDKVSSYSYSPGRVPKFEKKLFDLPSGGMHWTRSIHIYQNQLFTSVGSSCNVCNETDLRRASILVSDIEGNNLRPYATGLRNAVFMTTRPSTGEIFVTEMGRDWLGDDLPPDEINKLTDGKDYGWPYCYGANIFDTKFDQAKYKAEPGQNLCVQLNKTPSLYNIQAHSAPLGLVFAPSNWPSPFNNTLLVALHGSWNRSVPTGYKVIAISYDLLGNPVSQSDLISGWLKSDNRTITGRPVDVEFDPAGNLYISDDKSGTIYVITPK